MTEDVRCRPAISSSRRVARQRADGGRAAASGGPRGDAEAIAAAARVPAEPLRGDRLLMIDVDYFKRLQRRLRSSGRRRLPADHRRRDQARDAAAGGSARALRRRGVRRVAAGDRYGRCRAVSRQTRRSRPHRVCDRRRSRRGSARINRLKPDSPTKIGIGTRLAAGWQSGHAAACKAVDAGSIPTPASNVIK